MNGVERKRKKLKNIQNRRKRIEDKNKQNRSKRRQEWK